MQPAQRLDIVSNDDEMLTLVDVADRELGSLSKAECHDGAGVLHRAFSLFVFDAAGETLLQRRHADKRLWPGFWSNGCCSHPRHGESLEGAVVRRCHEELGLAIVPRFLFRFEYQAAFGDAGSEHELCSVFVGQSAEAPTVNATEIAEWRWIAPDELDGAIATAPDTFTPWLKIEWRRLREDHAGELPAAW